MESKTFYLKYRPQKVSDLDLTDVRENLQKILKSQKIPHAFLFSGPKGTGKTSAARIIAKTINCPHKKENDEPCNKCDICQEITAGSAMDLIEIDAASNRGIDDIRSLREKIKLSPAKCHYKVYIIDEVHMLTTEAFNALLKTLEEPPAHAVFILCTTEAQKLPKTIISRCLQIKFRKSKPEELVHSLERVVKGEKINLEKGVLESIAKEADGSFRDGQKILDQLAIGQDKISLAESEKLLGQIEELKPEKLLILLSQKNSQKALLEIDRIVNFGADLDVYLHNLLEKLRLALLKNVGVELENSEELDLNGLLDKKDFMNLIGLFTKAATEMKTTPILQLPLEMAVIEWCEDNPAKKTTNPVAGKSTIAEKGVKTDFSSEDKNNSVKENVDNPHKQLNSQEFSLKADENFDKNSKNVNEGSEDNNSKIGNNTLQAIISKWGDLLEGVKPLNHSVEALLKAARPLKMDKGFLVLEVFYKFHKERLDSDKCRSIVEEVASDLLGNQVRIKCVLGQKQKQAASEQEKNDIMEVASEIFNGKLVD